MNEIKRLRLQNQIFRHVATYYQKSSGAKTARENLAKAEAKAQQGKNPFELAEISDITNQVNDYCTFTRCELSADGSFAKIFVSVWGSEKEQERIMKEIKRMIPGMRSSIAKHVRMQAIPQLVFVQDRSFEKGSQIDKLL
ncbi:MAG: 30S ribosome-binding factor RbfA [Leptospiraceae bacterium]|nr:30S ribosome-binding factor RbfA [Leptospiraceae bacterium]